MDIAHRNRSVRSYDRRQFIKGLGVGAAGLAIAGTASTAWAAAAAAQAAGDRTTLNVGFDFENGNAIFDVFAPRVVPVIFATVSPSAMDATLVLRITTLIANGWSVPVLQGSSRIEPGITPASDIVLGPWATWTDFEDQCGLSRNWAGVHFLSSIPAGRALGQAVGEHAYEFVQSHIDGTA